MNRIRSVLGRLTWALWAVTVGGFALTIAGGAVLAGHVIWGVPSSLNRFGWLHGPLWLVAVGLGLQAFVTLELARIFGRWYARLSHPSGR